MAARAAKPNLPSAAKAAYLPAMTSRRRLAAALLALSCASLWAVHGAANAKPDGALHIMHPWTRPAAVGGAGAGYFTILAPARTGDRLLRVETTAAQAVGIHVSLETNGVMTMDEVKGGVRIDAGGKVDFKPGGLHLMFMGLKKTQKLGDTLPATLVFEKAGRVPVVFKVESGAPRPAGGMADMPGMKH